MLQMFRNNPGLIVWTAIFGIGAFVLVLVSAIAGRSGTTLRPVWWFAGFMLLIGGPQFVYHVYRATQAVAVGTPRESLLRELAGAADRESRASVLRRLVGPDGDPDLVTDAKPVFGNALEAAEVARLASFASGESVLLGLFRSWSAAEKGWVAYLRAAGLSGLGGKGDSHRGYAVTRPSGDRAYVLPVGTILGVWTGPDDVAIRRRMLAGGFPVPSRAPLGGADVVAGSGAPASPPGGAIDVDLAMVRSAWSARPGLWAGVAAAFAVYLLAVVGYFFKGASWASSAEPKPGVQAASASALIARLEAVNGVEVPFRVEKGRREGELEVIWRYADAKWVDLARARGMRRVHRIQLVLDEAERVVRAADFTASHDWSAGLGGADFEWKASMGIVFMDIQGGRVFGLQFDENGRPKPELSYAYRFNLMEMKSPLIQAVTQAGWTWRPVVWRGPRWLRWLTE